MIKEEKNINKLLNPLMFLIGTVAIVVLLITVQSTLNSSKKQEDDFVYVSKIILQNVKPVSNIKEDDVIGYPYSNDNIKEVRGYYDYTSSTENQENSLIFYDNTYIQNSGIDYATDEKFDVLCVLNGTVSSVKYDKLLGNIIEINHSNELISVYQSLSEVLVKEGDTITKGEVIGKTGTNNIAPQLNDHLHFELYFRGQVVNPNNFFNKSIKEL